MSDRDDSGYVRHGTALSRRLFGALGIKSAREKRRESESEPER